MAFLEIQNLEVSVQGKKILNDFSLVIEEGSIHAIMGPNGSGKSTLSNAIMGHPNYKIEKGKILFKNKDITALSADIRANLGIFLAMQYPETLSGISYASFLKAAINAKFAYEGKEPLDAVQFIKRLKTRAKALNVSDSLLKRFVNEGFSGGEKKKMEVFQMAFLEPSLCILDEVDAGLDIDALKTVADAVNVMKEPNRSFLLVTHFQRLLKYIEPDFVHVLVNGHIVHSGNKDLAQELEANGYAQYK